MKTAEQWFDARPNVISRSAWVAFIQNIQIDAIVNAEQERAGTHESATVDRPYEALTRAIAAGRL